MEVLNSEEFELLTDRVKQFKHSMECLDQVCSVGTFFGVSDNAKKELRKRLFDKKNNSVRSCFDRRDYGQLVAYATGKIESALERAFSEVGLEPTSNEIEEVFLNLFSVSKRAVINRSFEYPISEWGSSGRIKIMIEFWGGSLRTEIDTCGVYGEEDNFRELPKIDF